MSITWKNADGTWGAPEFVGACIRDWERNGYDDSDFFVTVWNEDKQTIENVLHNSTRYGIGYGVKVTIDASEEVLKKYKRWQRLQSIKSRLKTRKELMELAKHYGLSSRHAFIRLQKCPQNEVMRLLETKNFRSSFRASLAKQVREWVENPSPRYPQPLSRAQYDSLTRFLPTSYRRYR